jgi:hypothetical protein
MDKKLIEIYGEDILCYRLRTARQKKRMQYEDFDKHLIQLHKTQLMLRNKKRNLGWEPLVPPVQKGWKRLFVLREDVARSKHADFFQEILNKINTYDWSHRKDFMIKRRRFGRKIYVVKGQRVLEPKEHHFRKLSFSEKEQQLFHEEYRTERWSKKPVKRYVFVEPWRFVLRIRPNMIDKVRIKDAELESQITQLDNFLEKNDWEKRMHRLLFGNYKYKWWKWKELEKFDETFSYKTKSLIQLLDILKEEQ